MKKGGYPRLRLLGKSSQQPVFSFFLYLLYLLESFRCDLKGPEACLMVENLSGYHYFIHSCFIEELLQFFFYCFRRADNCGAKSRFRAAFSYGVQISSISSTGGWSLPGLWRMRLINCICRDVARRSASSSVSAAITLTATMEYGFSSVSDGWK